MRYLVLFGFLFSVGVNAQTLEFDQVTYDFGEIKEEGGKVDHQFVFKNVSLDTVWITNVRASCGCTTPAWTKERILPGDSGEIQARYNPYNRPGAFKKSLRVSLNNKENLVLYISGRVVPRPKTVEEDYPIIKNDLRFKFSVLNMGRVTTQKKVIKRFDVYNGSDSLYVFDTSRSVIPDFVELAFDPPVLDSAGRGKIVVTYDPQKRNELGYVSDSLAFGKSNSLPIDMRLIATIEEYFAPMSDEEAKLAPRLMFSNRILDFGRLAEGQTGVGEITLTNPGKTSLNLRAVKSNCECISFEIPQMDLAPEESVVLKVNFDTTKRRGRQYKTLTVFSNDPASPTQVVSVKADIQK